MGGPGLGLSRQARIIGVLFASGKGVTDVIRLLLDLAWLYARVVAETLWEDDKFRLLVWLLAVAIAIWRMASGHLTADDLINEVVLGIVFSLPFLW